MKKNTEGLVRLKMKSELADELNISLRTMQRKMKDAGIKVPRGYVTPDDQERIYAIFRNSGQ